MRYKFIILGLMILVSTTTTSYANTLSNKGRVGFYEIPSTVPSPPSEDLNLSEIQNDYTLNQILPHTGETSSSIIFIGAFNIALGALLIYKKRKVT